MWHVHAPCLVYGWLYVHKKVHRTDAMCWRIWSAIAIVDRSIIATSTKNADLKLLLWLRRRMLRLPFFVCSLSSSFWSFCIAHLTNGLNTESAKMRDINVDIRFRMNSLDSLIRCHRPLLLLPARHFHSENIDRFPFSINHFASLRCDNRIGRTQPARITMRYQLITLHAKSVQKCGGFVARQTSHCNLW